MDKRIAFAVSLVVVSGMLGCQQAVDGQQPTQLPGNPPTGEVVTAGDRPPSEVGFSVTVGDERVDEYYGASFSVSFPFNGEPKGDLSWSVKNESISLVVIAPYEAFRQKVLEIDLEKARAQPGDDGTELRATLFLNGEVISDGIMTLNIADGVVSGAFAERALTFEGVFGTSCATPSAENPEVVLIGDQDFSTPECASVRADGF